MVEPGMAGDPTPADQIAALKRELTAERQRRRELEAELAAVIDDLAHANQDTIRLEFIISKLPPLIFQQYLGVPVSASGITRGAIDIGIDSARRS